MTRPQAATLVPVPRPLAAIGSQKRRRGRARTEPSYLPNFSIQLPGVRLTDRQQERRRQGTAVPRARAPARPLSQGVLGSRFIPTLHSAASARGSGFRVGSGSARIRHKEAPVPAAQRRRGLQREGGGVSAAPSDGAAGRPREAGGGAPGEA